MIGEADVDAVLPSSGWLHDYVQWARGCIDAHVLYHVGVGLALLSQAVPRELYGPFGTKIRANLYVLLVGESGESRKTISIEMGRDEVLRASGIVKPGANETPGSHEILIDNLIAHPQQLICYSEFGHFLSSSEKGYLQPVRSAFTQVYDNGPLSRPTITGKKAKGGPSQVDDPRLSLLCGCSQPYLERHTDPSDWAGGFMSRFLMFSTVRERLTKKFISNEAGAKALAERLAIMHAAGQNGQGQVLSLEQSMVGPGYGPCTGFDPEADKLWDQWRDVVDARIKTAPLELRGSCSRAITAAMKIALILGYDYGPARQGQPWAIPVSCLGPAIQFANFHLRSIEEVGSYLALSQDMRQRRVVLDIIREGKGVPVPLYKIVTESKLLKRRVKELIDSLETERLVSQGVAEAEGDCYCPSTPEEVRREKQATPLLALSCSGQSTQVVTQLDCDQSKILDLTREGSIPYKN
jgi:Protein of unknown function (DUF3987)